MKRINLTKAEIESGLSRLDELARAEHRTVEIAIYGGAAIMLAWDMRAVTNDVDAIIMDARNNDFVWQAVKQIARENRWHEDWFNDAIKGYIMGFCHMEELPFFPDNEEGGLRLYVPNPEYFLAMKCMAMRLGQEGKQDGEDVKNILRMLNITSPEEVYDIVEKYYPRNLILPRVQLGIQQLIEEMRDEI